MDDKIDQRFSKCLEVFGVIISETGGSHSKRREDDCRLRFRGDRLATLLAKTEGWIPAFAGMTERGAGMTERGAGMTKGEMGMTERGAGMTNEENV